MPSHGPCRIGIIDSGIHVGHPHVPSISGGIAISRDGLIGTDFIDRIGHGTAVAAAIREKAPTAEIFAVKIFHDRLATRLGPLVRAIEWCVENGMDFINLSLGTTNPAHESALRGAIELVRAAAITLVSAYEEAGTRWLPGSLAGVTPAALDWDCPREQVRISQLPDGRMLYRASGYPRPIPGLPLERNLKGISFAVANVTGSLAAGLPVGH
ncbi:MAG TPA: S8 family serine peptidase [Bryobacteraceae bacterium]|nr:S8 family serine peptidase [Bryobacteraceae bacterium]